MSYEDVAEDVLGPAEFLAQFVTDRCLLVCVGREGDMVLRVPGRLYFLFFGINLDLIVFLTVHQKGKGWVVWIVQLWNGGERSC